MLYVAALIVVLGQTHGLGLSELAGGPVYGSLLQMTACDDLADLPMAYDNVVISKVSETKYNASGNINVHKDLEAPIKIDINVLKCTEKLNNQTCQFYTNWHSDGCNEIAMKQGPLFNIMKSTGQIPKSCPLPKGNYKLVNYEMDLPKEVAKVVATQGKDWHIIIKATGAEGVPLMCTDVWMQLEKEEAKRTRTFGK